jgi:hypothetical protein
MCYRLVEEVFEVPGNFESCIDCTYVLIMEGTPREEQIRKHVTTAGITSRVVYQYNKGYKKCHKKLRISSTNYDLEHALKNVFGDALGKGYKRILVLEDDCEFDDRIRNPLIIDDICNFLVNKNPNVYSLGAFLPVVNPLTFSNHQRLLLNSGSHAIIYNDEYMRWLMNNDCILGHTDFETNRHWSKFTYKLPLAYQKMTRTENVENGWKIPFQILNTLIFTPAGIDRQVQPGYDLIKKWSDILVVLLCVWILSHMS